MPSSNASALVAEAAIQPHIAQLLVLRAVQERDSVLAIVASVLHLGNIGFQQGDMDNAELLDEKSEDAMYTVSDLMQVSLLFAWFCYILRSCMLGKGRGDGDGAGGGGVGQTEMFAGDMVLVWGDPEDNAMHLFCLWPGCSYATLQPRIHICVPWVCVCTELSYVLLYAAVDVEQIKKIAASICLIVMTLAQHMMQLIAQEAC